MIKRNICFNVSLMNFKVLRCTILIRFDLLNGKTKFNSIIKLKSKCVALNRTFIIMLLS